MKKPAFLVLLLFFAGFVYADQVWPQPIEVCALDNVEYFGVDAFSADGLHLVSWRDNRLGELSYWLGLYTQQYQPLWPQAMQLDAPLGIMEIIATSDSCFVVICPNEGLRMHKINRNGDMLWGMQGITIPEEYYDDAFVNVCPDLMGGFYILWGISSMPNNFRSRMQHVSANGSLSMPLPGLLLENENSCYSSAMLIQPDNSVILGWSASQEVKINRLNPSGDFMWPQYVSIGSPESMPDVTMCAFNDGSFAICTRNGGVSQVRRFNSEGASMWPEPVDAILTNSSYAVTTWMNLGYDNRVLLLVKNEGSLYYQCIAADGYCQYSNCFNINSSSGSVTATTGIYPCDIYGAVSMVNSYQPDGPGNLKAIRILGNEVSIFPITETEHRKKNLTAYSLGNEMHVLWQESQQISQGFKAQILDASFAPALPDNGLVLETGPAGRTDDIDVAARDNGAVVIWKYTYNEGNKCWIYAQVYDSEGLALYDAPGLRLSSEDGTAGSFYPPCVGSNSTLVAWVQQGDSQLSFRLQIIRPDGSLQFPDGGLEFHSGSEYSTSLKADYFGGDWYLVWSDEMTLWGQKLSGNQLMWGNGLQLTQVHPNHNTSVWSFRLDWPWLIWQPLTKLVKRLEPDGSTSPGFPLYGLEMPPSYQGMELINQYFTPFGENLHALLSYYNSGTQDNMVYVQTVISPGGQFLITPREVEVEDNANVFTQGNEIYIGDYLDQYRLRKYDASGQMLFSGNIPITGFENDTWNVCAARFVASGYIQILAYGGRQGEKVLHYYYLDPEWELVSPPDNPVYSYADEYYPSLSHLGERSWIAWGRGYDRFKAFYAGVYLQSLMAGSSGVADPETELFPAPRVENCHPNPFNPTTTIDFSVPKAGNVKLSIYDLKGRKIRTMLDKELLSGKHNVVWDGKDDDGLISASGIYFIRIDACGKHHVCKVSLVK